MAAALRRDLLSTSASIKPTAQSSKSSGKSKSTESTPRTLFDWTPPAPVSKPPPAREAASAKLSAAEAAARDSRRAMLSTDPTIRVEVKKSEASTSKARWGAIRKSDEVTKAMAKAQSNESWTTVLKAIKANDARLFEAQDDLAKAKEKLKALDALLAGWEYEGGAPKGAPP